MIDADKRTYSVRLRPTTMKKLRILAIEREKSLSSLLEEAIADVVQKYADAGKK